MASMGEDGRGAWSRGQAAARVHRRGRAKQGGLASAESRRTAREAQSQPGVGENRPPERPSVVGSQTQESKPGWNGKRPPERPGAVVGQPQELPESRGQSAPERSRVKAGRSPPGPPGGKSRPQPRPSWERSGQAAWPTVAAFGAHLPGGKKSKRMDE